jgi:hypothetical protein
MVNDQVKQKKPKPGQIRIMGGFYHRLQKKTMVTLALVSPKTKNKT